MSEALEREAIIERIHEQGYLEINLGISESDFDGLFGAFADSAHILDQEDKDHRIANAFFIADEVRKGSQLGLFQRKQNGLVNGRKPDKPLPPGTDNKDILYFNRYTQEVVISELGRNIPQEVSSLLDYCEETRQAVRRGIRPIFRQLGIEEYFLVDEDVDKQEQAHELNRIKLINYREEDSNPDIFTRRAPNGTARLALPHEDYNRSTIAIKNTKAGLVGVPFDWGEIDRILYDETLTVDERIEESQSKLREIGKAALNNPINLNHGESAFFVGAGFQYMPQNLLEASGNLPPLLHAVTDTGHGRDRFALIAFINELDLYDWPLPGGPDCEFDEIDEYLGMEYLYHLDSMEPKRYVEKVTEGLQDSGSVAAATMALR